MQKQLRPKKTKESKYLLRHRGSLVGTNSNPASFSSLLDIEDPAVSGGVVRGDNTSPEFHPDFVDEAPHRRDDHRSALGELLEEDIVQVRLSSHQRSRSYCNSRQGVRRASEIRRKTAVSLRIYHGKPPENLPDR